MESDSASIEQPGEHEWLWQGLRQGQVDLVKSLAPSDFDWNSLHDQFGTPLMAVVHKTVLFGGSSLQESLHGLVRWIISHGGDPRKAAVDATALSVGLPPQPPGPHWKLYEDAREMWWCYDGPLGMFYCEANKTHTIKRYSHEQIEPDMEAECHAGHSAISLTLVIREKLINHGYDDDAMIDRADALLKVFAEAGELICNQSQPAMTVNPCTVDLWTAALQDIDLADVELRADGGVVKAHSLLLCNASSVLRAMLRGQMQEATSKAISVPGVSVEALRYLLALIYTGFWEEDEPSATIQLQALDLAHRWQVKHVVEGLELTLISVMKQEIAAASPEQQVNLLDKVLEAAVLKELLGLRCFCQELFNKQPLFKAALMRGDTGGFSQVSARYLRKLEGVDRKSVV